LKKIKRSQCIDITKNIKIHEKNMKNTIKIKRGLQILKAHTDTCKEAYLKAH